MQEINDLVAESKLHVAGDRESVLSSDTRALLDSFVEWLQSAEGKTQATARSYRSYVVTALTNGKSFAQQTSDVKSGVRALARYSETLES